MRTSDSAALFVRSFLLSETALIAENNAFQETQIFLQIFLVSLIEFNKVSLDYFHCLLSYRETIW